MFIFLLTSSFHCTSNQVNLRHLRHILLWLEIFVLGRSSHLHKRHFDSQVAGKQNINFGPLYFKLRLPLIWLKIVLSSIINLSLGWCRPQYSPDRNMDYTVSASLSVFCLFVVCLSVRMSICLSVCLPICDYVLFVCLLVCLDICFSVCFSLWLSVGWSQTPITFLRFSFFLCIFCNIYIKPLSCIKYHACCIKWKKYNP